MSWMHVLLPGACAATVTLLLTPFVLRLAVRLRAVDEPGGQKRHHTLTPRLGGLAIFSGVSSVVLAAVFLGPSRSGLVADEVLWVAVATLIVLAVGVVDDLRGLGPFQKLTFQVLAASIVVLFTPWQLSALRLPFDSPWLVGALPGVLSLVWIVGVTNAINFIDGLDGLAAGIVAIIAGSLSMLSILHQNPGAVVATSAIAGACVGFLRHNWQPAKIFMGDSGSLTLGFILAAVSLRSTPAVQASSVAALIPLLVFGLPVLDTLMVLSRRFLSGRRPLERVVRMFHADRTHVHHLLLDNRGAGTRKVMLTLCATAAGFCAMALVVAASDSWKMGVGFLAVETAAVFLIRRTGRTPAVPRLDEESLVPARSELRLAGERAGDVYP